MKDRETVITHLQIIHTWAEFARERDLQFFTAKYLEDIAHWTDDALNLLKEQEKEIDEISDEYLDLGKEMAKQPKFCPACGAKLTK